MWWGQRGEGGMKVYALKENLRKFIYHPLGRIRFDENGVADWPRDQFTIRRWRDGDVSLRPPEEAKESD
jgi:hypothetical protein